MFEFLGEYVVLIVLGICLCCGYILKNLVPTDKINKFIPLIMGVLGIGLNVWVEGFTFTPSIVLGGLFTGLASTGLHQLFKKFIEKQDTQEEIEE
jgi:hypothetical protein